VAGGRWDVGVAIGAGSRQSRFGMLPFGDFDATLAIGGKRNGRDGWP
jgi:hypothetical protein